MCRPDDYPPYLPEREYRPMSDLKRFTFILSREDGTPVEPVTLDIPEDDVDLYTTRGGVFPDQGLIVDDVLEEDVPSDRWPLPPRLHGCPSRSGGTCICSPWDADCTPDDHRCVEVLPAPHEDPYADDVEATTDWRVWNGGIEPESDTEVYL